MNPLLDRLQPYPFERLRQLFVGVTPNPAYTPISLGIGEPKHPTPEFIKKALADAMDGLAVYPGTAGEPRLRDAFRHWLQTRYGLMGVDANTQMLPVNGSREALFAFAQTVIDPGKKPVVVCPNPFYQIYEGAALLAGAEPYYAATDPARNFAVDWDSVPIETWARTQLLFVCSPGNPTGAVMPLAEWKKLFELSDRIGFVIASDECYSEIYFRDEPPLGGLQAAASWAAPISATWWPSPACPSAATCPACAAASSPATPPHQALPAVSHLPRQRHEPGGAAASIAAWGDEQHVVENRDLYRAKFAEVTPMLAQVLDVQLPDAGFLPVGRCRAERDIEFARDLLAQYNVTVLPGSYLARESAGSIPAPDASAWPWWPRPRNAWSRAAHRPVRPVQTKVIV
jgi:N-succinyldiaminopimelate aminotransferase